MDLEAEALRERVKVVAQRACVDVDGHHAQRAAAGIGDGTGEVDAA